MTRSIPTRPRRLAVLAFVVCLQLGALCAGVAHASSPWGEQAKATLPVGTGAGQVNFAEPTSFAVDPTNGSYYVADQIATKAHPTFRIQRFNAKGEVEASVSFIPPEEKKTSTGTAGEGLELAVDPARGRVYALVVYRRREASEKEQEERTKEEERLEKEGKKCGPGTCYERFPLDANSLAAGELYGFYFKNGELQPAKTEEVLGQKVPAPIMTDAVLKSQGEKPKEALLNPHGVAVDPATGDLAITGNIDEQEDLKVEKEEAPQECRAAAQYITIQEKTAGELSGSFGHRYVDRGEAFEELSCESASPSQEAALPFSPVITPGSRLLAEGQERSICPGLSSCNGAQVWELPQSANKIGEPGGIQEFEMAPHIVYALPEQQQLVVVKPEGVIGPTMSFVASGSSEGDLYLSAEVENKIGSGEPANGAVLALGYSEAKGAPEFSELGWTAGGHEASGEACVIPRPSGQTFLLGGFQEAGAGGKSGLVAFDAFEHEKRSVIDALQFGPGGSTSGCPRVTVTPPTIKAKGTAVTRIVPGEKVAFESTVEAANAASVEWKLENTTTKEVKVEHGGYQYQATKLERAFSESEQGVYKITEVIQTDDLASPPVEVEAASKLTVKAKEPEFQIGGLGEIANGEEVTLEAVVHDENAKTTPYKYVWKFGDGTELPEETTSGSTIVAKHRYGALCSCTVSLKVTDAEGTVGEATFALTVHMNKAEEEAIAAAAARKHQEAEAAEIQKRHEEEAAAAARKRQEEEAAKRKLEEEKAKSKPLTRAQLLARALKQCKKQPKRKRAKCEAQARKKYGPKRRVKKSKK